MFDSLTSRATFYDITGYLIPGICSEGVVWLWFYAFRPEPAVALLSGPLWKHGGFVVAIILVATGYITGHLMNSFSSLCFQKWICKARFERAANWQQRIQNDPAARTKRIAERASEVFGIPLEAVNTYELRIRGEEELPQSFVTGFSFLSFYGMNRTLALLSVLAAIPCCVIACRIRLIACPCFSVPPEPMPNGTSGSSTKTRTVHRPKLARNNRRSRKSKTKQAEPLRTNINNPSAS